MVKFLIDRGANPNLVDQNGVSPLHEAVIASKKGVVQLLINGGADVNKTDNYKKTPLSLAASKMGVNNPNLLQDHSIINILKDAGAEQSIGR